MKKSEAKANFFGRGSAAKHPSASAQSSSGIYVKTYLNFSDSRPVLDVMDFGRTFYAEELCYMAAEKLGITPLVVPLFALAHSSLKLWYPPNEKITCSEECAHEFILRIRFIPPESIIGKLPAIDGRMFNYLYQQIRSDFINDHIVFTQSVGLEHLLGLGVIDMVRYGKEHGKNLPSLRNLDPQDFIPATARNKFKLFFEKKRLHMNFKPHLEEQHRQYEQDTIVNTQLTYVKGVSDYSEHYGMETFRITQSDSRSAETVVEVKPYDAKFPGLNIYEDKVMWSCFYYLSAFSALCLVISFLEFLSLVIFKIVFLMITFD